MFPLDDPAPSLPIRTERLVLRAATPDDVDSMLTYYADPVVVRHLLHGVLDRAELDEKAARYARNLAPERTGDVLTLVVEHGGDLVGDLMLRLQDGDPPFAAELGWVFNPDHGGKGLATEAARGLLDLAFGHYGLRRVHAELDPRNVSSARLCERLGMTKEAHLRQNFLNKREWTDTAIYGLLRDEWVS
ncbi:MAG: GNAT family protein [Nocardioides sp.]